MGKGMTGIKTKEGGRTQVTTKTKEENGKGSRGVITSQGTRKQKERQKRQEPAHQRWHANV